MVFTYDFLGDDATITVTGKYGWDMVGRTLKRNRGAEDKDIAILIGGLSGCPS